jgi:predicted nucleic acid-binding protein
MQVFDASSIIYAWDNYPEAQFPKLWHWMADQMSQGNIVMPEVAFKEVAHVAPDCSTWLDANNLAQLPMNDQIIQEAIRIKNLLGIVGDKYGAGVGENDLFIIGTARSVNGRLISNEGFQAVTPLAMHKYKIPTVCAMKAVKVTCVNFVEFIKHSKVVFG